MFKIVKIGLCLSATFVMTINLAFAMDDDEQEEYLSTSRAIDRPMSNTVIPEIALGHEEIYERFLKGVLVYQPTKGSDKGTIKLPIAALSNPLQGEFDLSGCGNAGKYLRIYTGYPKKQRKENGGKLEISFVPWFCYQYWAPILPDNHYIHAVLPKWKKESAPVGIFWTLGNWNNDSDSSYCKHLTNREIQSLGNEDLFKEGQVAEICGSWDRSGHWISPTTDITYPRLLMRFRISFVN